MVKAVKKALKDVLAWLDKALTSVDPSRRVGLRRRYVLLSRNVWSFKKDLSAWNLLGRHLLPMRNLLFVETIGIRHLPDVIALPVHGHSPLDTVRRVLLAQRYHKIR